MSIIIFLFITFFLVKCKALLDPEPFDELGLGKLPAHTVFPGPWEAQIRASKDKSHIRPARIWKTSGSSYDVESVLESGNMIGKEAIIEPGSWVTFEFQENIGGR